MDILMMHSDTEIICRNCSATIARVQGEWAPLNEKPCGSSCEPLSCEDFDFDRLKEAVDAQAFQALAHLVSVGIAPEAAL